MVSVFFLVHFTKNNTSTTSRTKMFGKQVAFLQCCNARKFIALKVCLQLMFK